jgi:small subunit ribosomal protein S8
MITSPIHDLLIRIKNAYLARRKTVSNIPSSSFKISVLELLKKYGFIADFSSTLIDNKKFLTVVLWFKWVRHEDVPVLRFYSKPSKRWYVSKDETRPVAWGRWIWIISTNKWLMATHEAKKLWLWGELIAEIY